jgi:hypothetical protein
MSIGRSRMMLTTYVALASATTARRMMMYHDMTMTSGTMDRNTRQGTETDEECQYYNDFHDHTGLQKLEMSGGCMIGCEI